MTTLRPIMNRVIIKRHADKTESAGGIIIPDKHTEKPIKGDVIAVGPGRYLDNGDLIPPQVEVGDTVIFGERAGEEIKLEEEKFLVMECDAVLAIVVDEDND